MSTGRVSSREAERATLLTVATNAGAGHLHAPVAVGLRERREVLEAQRADVERRGAGDDLDVLLGGTQLERHGVARQRADDVDEQPRRQHDGAVADDLALERDAEPDLHVGGAQLDAPVAGDHLDAGERLDGAARAGRAGDGLELREQRVALGGKSHLVRLLQIRFGRLLKVEVTVIRAVDGVHNRGRGRTMRGNACAGPVHRSARVWQPARRHERSSAVPRTR